MSITGNLLDVSVADVLQFIHLGGRTGTLTVEKGTAHAEIGFHRGRIISAFTPGSSRVGDLLLEAGAIDQATLEEALTTQESRRPRESLGKILISMGAVTAEDLREAVSERIEKTVYELVTWKQGSFNFALDELRPVDDIGIYPGDILPDINLNTQMVVLEALRIFDEKHRSELAEGEGESGAEPLPEASAGAEPEPAGAAETELDVDRLWDRGQERPAASLLPVLPEVRLQIVSEDETLVAGISAALPSDLAEPMRVDLRDAGLTLPGELPPVVLLDLRRSTLRVDDVAAVRRTRARASIIVVIDELVSPVSAYAAGALAALPPDAAAVSSCVENVVRNRVGVEVAGSMTPGSAAGFAKLRRVIADLRSGLLSATVALNLMKVISESVDRAIMFLVRENTLTALGAFGFSRDGRPLASITNRLVIELEADSELCEAIDDGRTRAMLFEEARLPEDFAALIGRPRTGQVVIFPVLGAERVISVVYTDNGKLSREIEEIEILELAAAQVGVAFENEILRRKMERIAD